MSYEIVKSMKVDEKEGKVYVTSASNNVYPKYFHRSEWKSLSDRLVGKGRAEVDKTILLEYWNGNLQKSNNLYQQAVDSFDKTKYNWDYVSIGDSTEVREQKYQEIKDALYKHYLEIKNAPKGKYIVAVGTPDNQFYTRYLVKKSSRALFYGMYQTSAKVFKTIPEIHSYLKYWDIGKFTIVSLDDTKGQN